MNLRTIKQLIKNKADYAPPNVNYAKDLDQLINSNYFDLYNFFPWNFKEEAAFLQLLPDLEPSILPGITASYSDGRRIVTFSAPIPILEHKKDLIEGNLIELEGRAYQIVQILSSTQLTVTEPLRIVDGVASIVTSNWKIMQVYHYLPNDLSELLNVVEPFLESQGRSNYTVNVIQSLPQRLEERFLRSPLEVTNVPEYYVHVPPSTLPPAEKLGVEFEANETSTIPSSRYFELCWAFMSPDKVIGPLSEPKLFSSPTTGQPLTYTMIVNFLTFDDNPVESLNIVYNTDSQFQQRPFEGLRKVLFYNSNMNPTTGEKYGEPCWRMVINADGSVNNDDFLTAADIDSSVNITNIASLTTVGTPRADAYKPLGKLRFWPRPNGYKFEYEEWSGLIAQPYRQQEFFRRIEIRYRKRPYPLSLATDAPDMPLELVNVVVNKVLADVYNKCGLPQMASIYMREYDDQLKLAMKKYITNQDTRYSKGNWSILDNAGFMWTNVNYKP